MTGIPVQKEQGYRGEILTQFKFFVEDLLLSLFILLWPGQVLPSSSYVFSYCIFSLQPLHGYAVYDKSRIFTIEDFHQLSPTPKFQGLSAIYEAQYKVFFKCSSHSV